MNALIIESTEYTPEINLDPQNQSFKVSGFSRPEDVKGFYQKFFNWFDNNIDELKSIAQGNSPLKVEFRLVYFNSASSKCLLDLLMSLSEVYNKQLAVKWHYEEGDEDLLEAGEEFAEALEIPFEYVEESE